MKINFECFILSSFNEIILKQSLLYISVSKCDTWYVKQPLWGLHPHMFFLRSLIMYFFIRVEQGSHECSVGYMEDRCVWQRSTTHDTMCEHVEFYHRRTLRAYIWLSAPSKGHISLWWRLRQVSVRECGKVLKHKQTRNSHMLVVWSVVGERNIQCRIFNDRIYSFCV